MSRIHMLEGPVGSGKSTFASQLAKQHAAPVIILDEWMATLFSPDRPTTNTIPWYLERKERCLEQIWKTTCSIIASGSDIILELGLIQSSERQHFYRRANTGGFDLKLYVLDAPREVRRERVQQRNLEQTGTYAMDVPDHIFEMASNMWEPVDDAECELFEVEYIQT